MTSDLDYPSPRLSWNSIWRWTAEQQRRAEEQIRIEERHLQSRAIAVENSLDHCLRYSCDPSRNGIDLDYCGIDTRDFEDDQIRAMNHKILIENLRDERNWK